MSSITLLLYSLELHYLRFFSYYSCGGFYYCPWLSFETAFSHTHNIYIVYFPIAYGKYLSIFLYNQMTIKKFRIGILSIIIIHCKKVGVKYQRRHERAEARKHFDSIIILSMILHRPIVSYKRLLSFC